MWLAIAPHPVLPSACIHGVGIPEALFSQGYDFTARYPARTFPCQRFAPALAGSDA
jgi:hypothetical protein